ncbi:MAG: hypothetical protein IKD10_13670 [Lentisphaeria bacterium]|nr:hypothetical protein [Lentisphaerota bacterium]MBR7145971.1 hypothetical protein [Lentisphaeria bacterium]
MKIVSSVLLVCAAVIFCSCRPVHEVPRPDIDKISAEGSVVFTRPAQFTPFFGTYSLSAFIEIVYEQAYRNEAGQLVVEVGIRNRGPVSWTDWHRKAPQQLTLNTRCNFYRGNRVASPMVYSTNRQKVVIRRGETYAYKVVCPVQDAQNYQVVLGD